MNPDATASDTVLARAASGSRYTLLTQLARVGCKALSVIVVARLVSPADHGLYAMAASVTMFLFLFLDLGLGTAVVQSPTLSETQQTALLRAHLALGATLGLASLALAPLVARFYARVELTPLIATMSGAFLLNAAGGIPRALLARQLRFDAINRSETTAAFLATGAMLIAAALGCGAYTFAVFLLVSESVSAIYAWRICHWRPQPAADFEGSRAILHNGWRLTRYHMLNYGVQQIDAILLGQISGAHALGLYNRAAQLLTLPLLHVAGPLSRLAIAVLSRLATDRDVFSRQTSISVNLIAHLTLPLTAFAVAAPDEIVRVILGSQWPAAAPVLRWLAISAAATQITHAAYAVSVAAGTSRRLTSMAAVALPIVFAAVWVGARHDGPVGVAIALSVVNVALAVPRLAWSLQGSPVGLRTFLSALFRPLCFATMIALGATLARTLAANHAWPWPLVAALGGGFLAAAVALLLSVRLRHEWRTVWSHLPGLGETTRRPIV